MKIISARYDEYFLPCLSFQRKCRRVINGFRRIRIEKKNVGYFFMRKDLLGGRQGRKLKMIHQDEKHLTFLQGIELTLITKTNRNHIWMLPSTNSHTMTETNWMIDRCHQGRTQHHSQPNINSSQRPENSRMSDITANHKGVFQLLAHLSSGRFLSSHFVKTQSYVQKIYLVQSHIGYTANNYVTLHAP